MFEIQPLVELRVQRKRLFYLMSNTIRIFFVLFLTFFSVSITRAQLTEERKDSLTSQANFFFKYDQLPKATLLYEEVLNQGFFHEQMLYRLAYMHEQMEAYPQSNFYLRKIQWEYGAENIEGKVLQLIRKMTRERVSLGTPWSESQLTARYYETYLIGGIVTATLLLVLMLFVARAQLSRAIGIALTATILICTGLLLANYYQTPPKGVIVESTPFYDLPGYGAESKVYPIYPGALVDVLDKQDIWVKVSMGKFTGWIPAFTLRKV